MATSMAKAKGPKGRVTSMATSTKAKPVSLASLLGVLRLLRQPQLQRNQRALQHRLRRMEETRQHHRQALLRLLQAM